MTTTWDHIDHDPISITSTLASSTTCGERDNYTVLHADVDQHRIALATALNTALAALQDANNALGQLTSSHVYDIEFSEGRPGSDVANFLDDSLRYTRAAYTITHTITERG